MKLINQRDDDIERVSIQFQIVGQPAQQPQAGEIDLMEGMGRGVLGLLQWNDQLGFNEGEQRDRSTTWGHAAR